MTDTFGNYCMIDDLDLYCYFAIILSIIPVLDLLRVIYQNFRPYKLLKSKINKSYLYPSFYLKLTF